MKTLPSVLLLISLFLSGCGAATPPTATLVESTPTVSAPQEPTSTVSIVTPTIEVLPEGQQTAPPLPAVCQRPQNWVAYTVSQNDTLSSLGQRTGTGWQQIQSANCLTSTIIFSGQTLYLPFIPPTLAVTNLPSTPPPPSATPVETFLSPDPGDPNLAVAPKEGPPGTLFIFTLDTFVPGETVTLTIKIAGRDPREVYRTTVQMSGLGNAVVPYQSPVNAEQKMYIVEALGAKTAPNDFTITAP